MPNTSNSSTTPQTTAPKKNGGENWEQLACRVTAAVEDIIRVHPGGNLLIISHGHTLRLLLALMKGATWQNHRAPENSESLHNTAINIVHYCQDDSGAHYRIGKHNDIAHLA